MKLKSLLFVFLFAMILVFSFTSTVYARKNKPISLAARIDQHSLFAFPIPLIFGEANDNPPPLNQSTRIQIYSFIRNNPGIQFRGICNSLNLSVGVAQYHLGILTKAGLLSIFQDGRYKRFFKSKRFTEKEMAMISLLRHQTAERILSLLLRRQHMSHNELASKLSISSQALTWQISRLEKIGIVRRTKDVMKTVYFLDEANALTLKRCIDVLEKKEA